MSHFKGHFEGALTFLTRVQKSRKSDCPAKKNIMSRSFLNSGTLICPYVLLPYIIYVMQSGGFSQSPAFLSRMAKELDEKYSVKLP
jgi:hypothetical protein